MMIRLTAKDIADFQTLHKQETGQDITLEQAAEYAERVIGFVGLICQLQPREPWEDADEAR